MSLIIYNNWILSNYQNGAIVSIKLPDTFSNISQNVKKHTVIGILIYLFTYYDIVHSGTLYDAESMV